MRRPARPRPAISRARAKAARKGAAASTLGAWAELVTDAVIATQDGRIQALNSAGRDLLGTGRPLDSPSRAILRGLRANVWLPGASTALSKDASPRRWH